MSKETSKHGTGFKRVLREKFAGLVSIDPELLYRTENFHFDVAVVIVVVDMHASTFVDQINHVNMSAP